nr:DUF3515 domain-containing protein [Streptomyces sp. SID5468]
MPATVLLTVAGCSSGPANAVAVPSPSPSAAAICRALHDRLPGTVDGLARHATTPASPFTAAWGNPQVELRCGVPRPRSLTPGDPHYDPTAEAVGVNDVTWLPQQFDGGYRFTTTGRAAFVEVTVPSAYKPEVNPLTDLAAAVKRADPTEL